MENSTVSHAAVSEPSPCQKAASGGAEPAIRAATIQISTQRRSGLLATGTVSRCSTSSSAALQCAVQRGRQHNANAVRYAERVALRERAARQQQLLGSRPGGITPRENRQQQLVVAGRLCLSAEGMAGKDIQFRFAERRFGTGAKTQEHQAGCAAQQCKQQQQPGQRWRPGDAGASSALVSHCSSSSECQSNPDDMRAVPGSWGGDADADESGRRAI